MPVASFNASLECCSSHARSQRASRFAATMQSFRPMTGATSRDLRNCGARLKSKAWLLHRRSGHILACLLCVSGVVLRLGQSSTAWLLGRGRCALTLPCCKSEPGNMDRPLAATDRPRRQAKISETTWPCVIQAARLVITCEGHIGQDDSSVLAGRLRVYA